MTPPSKEVGALPSLEQRIESLLTHTAQEIRPCKACGARLAFVRHNNGKLAPYTVDGLNHFINCPQASSFKRGAK
jgi:uncharacterized protein with PIN domain